jgi:hypothetical protein
LEEKLPGLAIGALLAVSLVGSYLTLPFSLPAFSPENTIAWGQEWVGVTGVDGPLRWEDGQVRSLPQDYADMLGWSERSTCSAFIESFCAGSTTADPRR